MSAFIHDIAALQAQGTALTGLPAGAAAQAIAALPKQALWVVVPDGKSASVLTAELRWLMGEGRVCSFPADDVEPYEGFSPHPSLPTQRILAQDRLAKGEAVVVVAPAVALMQRVLAPQVLSSAPVLKLGGTHDPEALARTLPGLGYMAVGRVQDVGTFRLRGDLLQIWCAGDEAPCRLEFFDDELERIQRLDPVSGRPVAELKRLRLMPVREEVIHDAALARCQAELRERVGELGWGGRVRRDVIQDFKAGIRFSGCGAYLAALHPLVAPLSYSAPCVVLDSNAVLATLHEWHRKVISRFERLSQQEQPLMHPSSRYVEPDQVEQALAGALRIEPRGREGEALDLGCFPNPPPPDGTQDLAAAAGRLGAWLSEQWRVGVVVDSTARADRLKALLAPHGLKASSSRSHDVSRWKPGVLQLVRGDLPRGFHSPDAQLAVLTADELLGRKVRVRQAERQRGKLSADLAITNFAQLRDGDLVVHDRHGIGRFHGLRRVELGQGPEDMVWVEYRGGDRLYLPAHRLDHLFRYRAAGGPKQPRLDKLGGDTWSLRRSKVKDAMLQLAHELIALQARRQVNPGTAYAGLSARFRRFEDAFPYNETPDQARAIKDVLDDLALPTPMDRLVVGDVGFGKTEVAMRAAFRVAEAGRQIAILCPTTVLAAQHARTFTERFAPFGVKVGLLSRFSDSAQARTLKKQLRAGEIDIVIGTTSLLGRAVRFSSLGLVVVDEEHRFGVKQKERLKRLRAEVDYLAMSATPIPRSLHQAVTGIRGISVISTPPPDRLAVYTAVTRHNTQRIREDLMRELSRGGQAFFVHNRVASIAQMARAVSEAVPEAKVQVAHGKLPGDEVDRILMEFAQRKSDVLVCTAIIESGLDMPNVNTILVNRADQFGLAQLYQLRGRVGRSHRRGYCTLMADEGVTLTKETMRRLEVLQEHTRLGSGFAVATADMELRGAGNLLGDRQHGNIKAVGFETWLALLDEAMAEARGDADRQSIDPEVELGIPCFIPNDYLDDADERLLTYRRLSACRSPEQVLSVLDELERDNGELPPEVLNLGRMLQLKSRCRVLGVQGLRVLKVRAAFEFSEKLTVPMATLRRMADKQPARFQLTETGMDVRFTPAEGEQIFPFLHWAVGLLEKAVGAGE